jgi:hypothetical protein
VRGTFIQVQEGELIDFKGGPNSLNSRLKLIELNPYNTNYFSSNPYKSLPENMLKRCKFDAQYQMNEESEHAPREKTKGDRF